MTEHSTFEFVLHFEKCGLVTLSPNQISIIIIIDIIIIISHTGKDV